MKSLDFLFHVVLLNYHTDPSTISRNRITLAFWDSVTIEVLIAASFAMITTTINFMTNFGKQGPCPGTAPLLSQCNEISSVYQ